MQNGAQLIYCTALNNKLLGFTLFFLTLDQIAYCCCSLFHMAYNLDILQWSRYQFILRDRRKYFIYRIFPFGNGKGEEEMQTWKWTEGNLCGCPSTGCCGLTASCRAWGQSLRGKPRFQWEENPKRVYVPFQGSVDILITFCFLWNDI